MSGGTGDQPATPSEGHTMADRTVFHVVPKGPGWQVQRDGDAVLSVDTKKQAIDEARALAKELQPSQVVVHTADGRIEDEMTYQDDPFPPRG